MVRFDVIIPVHNSSAYLKKCLNSNATVIFDDILLYGYVTCVEAEVPAKYRENRLYMINFLNQMLI